MTYIYILKLWRELYCSPVTAHLWRLLGLWGRKVLYYTTLLHSNWNMKAILFLVLCLGMGKLQAAPPALGCRSIVATVTKWEVTNTRSECRYQLFFCETVIDDGKPSAWDAFTSPAIRPVRRHCDYFVVLITLRTHCESHPLLPFQFNDNRWTHCFFCILSTCLHIFTW